MHVCVDLLLLPLSWGHIRTDDEPVGSRSATSFCKVNLRELNRVLKEDASVIISKRYAETLDLEIEGDFKATTKNIIAHCWSVQGVEGPGARIYTNIEII